MSPPNLRQSLVITFFSSNGATAVHFLVIVILARILTPAEVGIYSITAVLVAIAHYYRDFGVVSFLQREKHLTKELVGAAFGVLLTFSWAIAAIVYSISGLVAAFYQQPGVGEVMKVLALGFVFIPFGAITQSLLIREYRAKEEAIVKAISTLVYAVSVITLAYLDFSYMALAWANLINIIATGLAYLPFRPEHSTWRPRFSGWNRVINFGAGATLGNSLVAVNNAVPDLVLGKLSGPYDVGIMSRAQSTTGILNQLIGPTVNYAVLPYLAKTFHAGNPLSDPLAKAVSYITVLLWPALIATALYADPIVKLLYGQNWLEAVPIIQIICMMIMLVTPFKFLNNAYMAIGRPYLATVPTAIDLTLKLITISLMYSGTLISFTYALLASTAAMIPVHMIMQKMYFQLKHKAFAENQLKSLMITIILGFLIYVLQQLTSSINQLVSLSLVAALYFPAWICLIFMLNHPIKSELLLGISKFPMLQAFIESLRTKERHQ